MRRRWALARVFRSNKVTRSITWTTRLVLVADAAHSIHPLAGQGINLGLSDVRILARELLAGRAGGLPVSSPVSLKRYQRQRKSENLAMMAAMEGFKRGFGSPHPAAVILRNVGSEYG